MAAIEREKATRIRGSGSNTMTNKTKTAEFNRPLQPSQPHKGAAMTAGQTDRTVRDSKRVSSVTGANGRTTGINTNDNTAAFAEANAELEAAARDESGATVPPSKESVDWGPDSWKQQLANLTAGSANPPGSEDEYGDSADDSDSDRDGDSKPSEDRISVSKEERNGAAVAAAKAKKDKEEAEKRLKEIQGHEKERRAEAEAEAEARAEKRRQQKIETEQQRKANQKHEQERKEREQEQERERLRKQKKATEDAAAAMFVSAPSPAPTFKLKTGVSYGGRKKQAKVTTETSPGAKEEWGFVCTTDIN